MKHLSHILRKAEIDMASFRLLYQLHDDTVHGLTADGYDALDLWEKLCDLVPQTGHWPVILGRAGEEDLPTIRSIIDASTGIKKNPIEFPDTQRILREAEEIDAIQWFARTHREHIDYLKEEMEQCLQKGYEEDAAHFRAKLTQPYDFQGIPRSDWPADAEPTSPFGIGAGITHDKEMNSYEVTIALFPTSHGWQAPAFLKFGGWNACPRPHEHVAILRHWEQRFGARLVCLTEDTIECMVSRPPRTRRNALLLARDQYLYCEDIVLQGTYSLEALAAGLLRGEAWYFWWD